MNRISTYLYLYAIVCCLLPLPIYAHQYGPNGVCTEEGCTSPYQQPRQEQGVYLLGNAGEVEWFSMQVNQGGDNMFLNAVLTADIDFEGVSHTPIGSTAGHKFNGKFDGQGHRILNLKMTGTENLQGFFGGLRGGGTLIENLILDRSCSIRGGQRVGGIAAFAQTIISGPIVIRNCVNEATITGTGTAVGGILGGSMSPHPAIHIRNCLNTGIISGAGESAVIAGWAGDHAETRIEYCCNTGTLTGMDASNRNMARYGSAVHFGNNYDMNPPKRGVQGIGQQWVTQQPLSSGELCYLLNAGQPAVVWFQTLETDTHPLPFPSHRQVYLTGERRCDGTLIAGASAFSNVPGEYITTGHQYEDGICQYCGEVKPGYYTTPRKVFLVAGQSNADGRAPITTMPQYIRNLVSNGGSKFCYWSYGNGTNHAWETFGGRMSPYMPYTDNNTTTRCGFDGIVYHLLEERLKERFYVIKESRGGTAIDTLCTSTGNLWWCCDEDWLNRNYPREGHSLAKEFTENIDAIINNVLSQLAEGYEFQCIIWHQGESDRTRATEYRDNLRRVVQYLRKHLVEKTGEVRYATLPFIAGTFNRSSTQYSAGVESALQTLAREDSNFHVVDLSTCQLGTDNLHFDAKGCESAAWKIFEQLEALGLLDSEQETSIGGIRQEPVSSGYGYDLGGRAQTTRQGDIYIINYCCPIKTD